MDENQNVTTEEQNVPVQNAAPQGQPFYQAPQMDQNVQNNQYQQPNQNAQYGQYQQPNQNAQYGQYQQPNQNAQYGQYQQNPYGQQAYQNPPVYMNQNGYAVPQQKGTVKDIFCNIVLVLNPLVIIIAIVMVKSMLTTLESSMLYGSYYGSYYNSTAMFSPVYLVCMLLSLCIGIATLIFVILDIVQVHKGNYPITGLILFAIFLRPGYYVWRAHVLGRKMTFPIIYTVGYALLMVGYMIWMVVEMCQWASNMMMYAM